MFCLFVEDWSERASERREIRRRVLGSWEVLWGLFVLFACFFFSFGFFSPLLSCFVLLSTVACSLLLRKLWYKRKSGHYIDLCEKKTCKLGFDFSCWVFRSDVEILSSFVTTTCSQEFLNNPPLLCPKLCLNLYFIFCLPTHTLPKNKSDWSLQTDMRLCCVFVVGLILFSKSPFDMHKQ